MFIRIIVIYLQKMKNNNYLNLQNYFPRHIKIIKTVKTYFFDIFIFS